MSNLLTAIRDAVRPGAQLHALETIEGEPGATASIPEAPPVEANSSGGNMSANQTVAGAASAATAAIAAVTAAASGGQDGFKAAMDRINTIMAADGIKGDAKRMNAALDLANASPDMSADAVVAFVTANVPATSVAASEPAAPQASAYEKQRLAAANLAMPSGSQPQASQPKISATSIFEMRRNALKGA